MSKGHTLSITHKSSNNIGLSITYILHFINRTHVHALHLKKTSLPQVVVLRKCRQFCHNIKILIAFSTKKIIPHVPDIVTRLHGIWRMRATAYGLVSIRLSDGVCTIVLSPTRQTSVRVVRGLMWHVLVPRLFIVSRTRRWSHKIEGVFCDGKRFMFLCRVVLRYCVCVSEEVWRSCTH